MKLLKREGMNMANVVVREFVKVKQATASWETAIAEAAEPLMEAGYISQGYVDQMILNVKELGSYIVIMPNVALPHARSEYGAFETGVAIMKLQQAVLFPADQAVQLIVVLAAKDNTTHMQLLSDLVDVFMDEQKMQRLFDATGEAELYEVLA